MTACWDMDRQTSVQKTMSVVGVALLFGCALSFSLPAPENLSIQSLNFNHTLSWNPGAGTPPGTSYMIYNVRSRRHRKLITKSNKTSAKLTLQYEWEIYYLTVVATYNNSRSPDSPKLQFLPYEETQIGPLTVSVAGCGRCLHVNITLPGADSGVDIHRLYQPDYRVNLRKQGEKLHGKPHMTKARNFMLQNLHSGTEYCVQVQVLTINTNIQPSAWTCAFTSRAEPSTGGVMVGLVFLLVFVTAALMAVFCLYHLGFICKLKVMLPTVLRMGLSAGYTLTPERTIPDLISISPKVEKHKRNSAAAPQPAESAGQEEEEEEQEEEEEGGGRNIYVVRNTEFSSGEGSCSDSADRLCEAGLPAGEQCDEAEDEGEEVGQTEDQKDEEEEEQVFNCSGDINLVSVTLRVLVECEEEGQALEWMGQEALLSHDQTSKSARTPVEDQSVSDEEEEQEFSAYLRHS